jgi:hypothetical protein
LKRIKSSRETDAQPPSPKPPRKHRRVWRVLGITFLTLGMILGVARAMAPRFVRNYVNRTLDKNENYSGTIGDVEIHLWRGAYSIQDIRISKKSGSVLAPFFAAKRVDFAIQWNALRHRRIVGRVFMDKPEINFVDSSNESEKQSGAGGPWMQMIRDLSPFKINSAVIKDGEIHFLANKGTSPVDVYLSQVQAKIDNLGNIRDDTSPLVSSVHATAVAMNHAKLEYQMTFDPFSYRPTFHMATRLIGLDVTTLLRQV